MDEGPNRFSVEMALKRLLADPEGARRLDNAMRVGDLRELPKTLGGFGIGPVPREICIELVQVIHALVPGAVQAVTQYFRYFDPPPHTPNSLCILLSDEDIEKLKSTFLPTPTKNPPPTPVSLWDFLLATGYIEARTTLRQSTTLIDDRRTLDICRTLRGDPYA